ncbi:unnamed protein product [Penicillium roqueforti FM164]|uniref:Genomic scaffold, ProqFM164S01 n=1 Tax=Penicillium roqueforti (strain FM164) TaxID=1365484 RepID=W6PYM0_PENRF|nr:unnamed protein product [Penicillium roqueforti FM164]
MTLSLAPQYEIRLLGPEHEEWARAICIHINIFHSPLWPVVYPENNTQRAYQTFRLRTI